MAWAAGLFEGEGCIAPGGRRALTLRMCDEDVVRRFARVVGAGRVRQHYSGNERHRPSWEWSVGTYDDCRRILLAFLPHLGDRRAAKAREVLASPPKYVVTGSRRRIDRVFAEILQEGP